MLKEARRLFPEQEQAYENIKTLILVQAKHIRLRLDLENHAGAAYSATVPA